METDLRLWGPLAWFAENWLAILLAVGVLLAGAVLARLATATIRTLAPRAPGIDRNIGPLLAQVAGYGIVIVAIVVALSLFGVQSATILTVLGAAGLAIALALQSTLSNIAAGIMLIWLRPLAIGEYIQGDGVAGVVVEIGLFGTRLRSTNGLYVFTPNQRLWAGGITNHSREPHRRIDVKVSIPDTINIAKARRVLLRLATADKRVLVSPEPAVHVDSFSGNSVGLQLRAWVDTPHYQPTLFALTEEAKLALDKETQGDADAKSQIHVAPDPATPSPDTRTPGT